MTTLQGIDVSNLNQAPFPWLNWRGKIQFAGVKISEGVTFADPDAAANIAGARALGLVVMGYHFLHNGVNADGTGGAQQAEWFLKWAHAAGLKPGDLIAVDVEDLGLGIDLTKASAADVEQAYRHFDLVAGGFLNELKKHWAGYNAVVYTEISAAGYLAHCGESPLWLANPSGTHTGPLGPWKTPSFEQTGQRSVDTDVFYGTVEQLKALAIPHAG